MALGQEAHPDEDWDSPSIIIPSSEIDMPFPQGVGGDRVDAYIEGRFVDIRERAEETLRENALARESAQTRLASIRELRTRIAYRLGRMDGLLEAAGHPRKPRRNR